MRTVAVLSRLFRQVLIAPAVFQELQQPNAPVPVQKWAGSLPAWCRVKKPDRVQLHLDLDAGERETLCLAKEVGADVVLMDDRAGRLAAGRCGLRVVGTIGILDAAAERVGLDLPDALAQLCATNARLSPKLIEAALTRDARRKQPRQAS